METGVSSEDRGESRPAGGRTGKSDRPPACCGQRWSNYSGRPSSSGLRNDSHVLQSKRLELALLDGLARGIRCNRGTSLADLAAQPGRCKGGPEGRGRTLVRTGMAEIAGDSKSDPVLPGGGTGCWPSHPLQDREAAAVVQLLCCSRARICGCWPWRPWRRSAIRPSAGCCSITWQSQTPSVHWRILEALLNQPQRINLLLDDMAAGKGEGQRNSTPCAATGCWPTAIRQSKPALRNCWPRPCRPIGPRPWSNTRRRSD